MPATAFNQIAPAVVAVCVVNFLNISWETYGWLAAVAVFFLLKLAQTIINEPTKAELKARYRKSQQ